MEHDAVKVDILTPDVTMVFLTWLTFFLLLFILKKFAWKPILDGLQQREDHIRKSLKEADEAKRQLQEVHVEKVRILDEARQKAQVIVEDSRRSAAELAKQSDQKAKANARQIVESAHQQTEGERERVLHQLRQESAAVAVALASKIIKENMDNDKNHRLVQEALKEIA